MNRMNQRGPFFVESSKLDGIDDALRHWEPLEGCGGTLQAGDLGWKLRFGRQQAAESLREWRSPEGKTVAVVCQDSPTDWWLAIDPAHTHDLPLADSIANWAIEENAGASVSVDGPGSPAVWRQAFEERGFEAASDAWAHLWKPLSIADAVPVSGTDVTFGNDQAIADRVAVHRAAFTSSTFTVQGWHDMAAGPSFRPEFDLLARDDAGEPVAAITVWLPGPGKCGVIEPMGTHPHYRRRGHGRRVILAACAALAGAGASGVCVVTPESNPAAVGVYQAAGMRRISQLSFMVRPASRGRNDIDLP